MENEASLNNTPRSERVHIGFYGMRNAGKSSVVNAVLGQPMSIVSDQKGTTTDPVQKAMELLPLGPVVIIDTPGLDDIGELGELRIKKAKQMLAKTDIAVVVIDANVGASDKDLEIIEMIKKKQLPYIVVYNKADLETKSKENLCNPHIFVSAKTGAGIHELKEKLATLVPEEEEKHIVADLVEPHDFVVLVVPVDKAAPKGRLILPQQQTIRDLLDADATSIVVKEYELKEVLQTLGKKPKLVITDSQVFAQVSKDTPEDISLTSFSILFARYKGNLRNAVKGVKVIETLKDGDTILISEGCTHHRQCDDIGSVKLPKWIKEYTKKDLKFEFSSGTNFPLDLSKYKMVVHCGGCMLNEKEMKSRALYAKEEQIPMTNYGILIAYMKGILARSGEIFPEIAKELNS